MVSEALLGRIEEVPIWRQGVRLRCRCRVAFSGHANCCAAVVLALPRYSGDVPRHPFVREWRSPPCLSRRSSPLPSPPCRTRRSASSRRAREPCRGRFGTGRSSSRSATGTSSSSSSRPGRSRSSTIPANARRRSRSIGRASSPVTSRISPGAPRSSAPWPGASARRRRSRATRSGRRSISAPR